jgi:predicted nucleic acid-binding protein
MTIRSDSKHHHAVAGAQYLAERASTILIPAEVLAETINILGKKFDRTQAIAAGRKLTHDEAFVIIETNSLMRSRALDLMAESAGSVSYVDCLVMAVADHHDTRLVFGFDDIFQKRGYFLPSHQRKRHNLIRYICHFSA